MPNFKFSHPYARDYRAPSRLGHVEPGQIVEADENPDPNFFEAVETDAAKAIAARQATTTTSRQAKRPPAAVPSSTESEEVTP